MRAPAFGATGGADSLCSPLDSGGDFPFTGSGGGTSGSVCSVLTSAPGVDKGALVSPPKGPSGAATPRSGPPPGLVPGPPTPSATGGGHQSRHQVEEVAELEP